MSKKSSNFLRPNIDFSDDEEDSQMKPSSVRKTISNQIKKTQTNLNAIKTPNTRFVDDADEEEDEYQEEVLISDDDDEDRSPQKKNGSRKRESNGQDAKRKSKKSKKSESDDEFLPQDDNDDENDDSDSAGEESVASEDLSEDENISDSDFNPNSDEEQEEGDSIDDADETVQLSSDGESPDKKESSTKTFDPNSQEFWDKVQDLRSKGFSIQQQSSKQSHQQGKTTASAIQARNVPSSTARPRGPAQHQSRFSAFVNLCTNFDHEKRCLKKCFLMDPRQKQTLSEIQSPGLITPEFVKGCIKIVNCNIRLGEVEAAREMINITNNLGNIPNTSALCQAMVSGARAQEDNITRLEELEQEGMEALKSKQFSQGIEIIDKALLIAGSCLRLKMARGDCLAHLGRYVEGAKAASSILQQDQRNTGALFLRGFCLYHKNNIDRAVTHFSQVLQINRDHERAKTLLNKAKAFKEKREQASKANLEKRYQTAENILSEALKIDPKNKGVNSNILAERAETYLHQKKLELSVADCEAALKLDQSCLAALLQRAKCHVECGEWEQAVRIMERMNSRDRHNQQAKLKAAEAAKTSGNVHEAWRLYQEAVDVDKHNQKYRHLLREAKQELLQATRVDHYSVLGLEKTVGESEIRKAYFKKSKEYHPDKHANASEEVKEEFSKKFKHAKEAYEILSDNEKRKMYDSGRVKAPPGGWYQDVDHKIFESVQMRGAMRGRPVIRASVRGGPMLRGGVRPMLRPGVRPVLRPGIRPRPVNVRQSMARPVLRPGGVRPTLTSNQRPIMVRPRQPTLRQPLIRGAFNRPRLVGQPRPRLSGVSITPLSSKQPDIVNIEQSRN